MHFILIMTMIIMTMLILLIVLAIIMQNNDNTIAYDNSNDSSINKGSINGSTVIPCLTKKILSNCYVVQRTLLSS